VRSQLGLLGDNRRVHVDNLGIVKGHLPGRFLEKHLAGGVLPARIGVRKVMPDVALAQSAKNRIAYGVHQHIRVRMPFEPPGMRNFHTPQDQLPTLDQWMHIITNPHVNHVSDFSGKPHLDNR
jgi:hypothetical protein